MTRRPNNWVARAIRSAEMHYAPYVSTTPVGLDRKGNPILIGTHVFIRKGTHHLREARVMGMIAPPFKPMLVVNLYDRGERVEVQQTVPPTHVEVLIP